MNLFALFLPSLCACWCSSKLSFCELLKLRALRAVKHPSTTSAGKKPVLLANVGNSNM
jgi:hypothetical protein